VESICQRCERIAKQKLYRVTTEDAGVVVLNILVCSACARLAKRLGLATVKMEMASAERSDKIESDSMIEPMKRQATLH
jgi:hypothetical protein